MDDMTEEQRKAFELVEASVEKAMKGFLLDSNNDVTRSRVEKCVSDFLGSVPRGNKTDVQTQSGWDSLGWKGKLKWFFANKMFKWVGKEMRYKVDEANDMMREAIELIIVEDLDNITGEEQEKIHGIWEAVERVKVPMWAELKPKEMVVIDLAMALSKPIKRFHAKFKITKDGVK